ncbi:MAG: hypothetical protein IIX14_05040 [Clostridia bacterium]|nr:hypothetical protein [Clostridia bacterium]
MATIKTFKIIPGTNLAALMDVAAQNLSLQGFEVKTQVLGPQAAELIVTKDRQGFKNTILGLGLESRAAVTVSGDIATITITSEWTSKILPAVIGWFLCWVPIVTDIVGIINQAALPDKIGAALNLAFSSGAGAPVAQPFSPVEPADVDYTPVDPEEI